MRLRDDPCWFCKERPAEDCPVRLTLHREVHRDSQERAYIQKRIAVPRCSRCAERHEGFSRWQVIGAVAGLLPGLAVASSVVSEIGLVFGLLLPLVVFGMVGAGIGTFVEYWATAGKPGSLSFARKYPPVQEMLSDGWLLGDAPGERV